MKHETHPNPETSAPVDSGLLSRRYHELLYAVLDPGFADKRTDEEAHTQVLEYLRKERAEMERRHNKRDLWASALEGMLTMSKTKLDPSTLSELCALARDIRGSR